MFITVNIGVKMLGITRPLPTYGMPMVEAVFEEVGCMSEAGEGEVVLEGVWLQDIRKFSRWGESRVAWN